jgi:nitrite reductase/ring-hydroxylating ferredoxin subunit
MPVPSEWRCPLTAVPPGHTAKFRLACPKHPLAARRDNHLSSAGVAGATLVLGGGIGRGAKPLTEEPGGGSEGAVEAPFDDLEGFVVNHGGRLYAYVNRCAHVGTPLDLWPNEFLSEDGRALVCTTHRALYEPATGLCTAGPCVGAALTALPLRRDGDELVVSCPHP